MAQWDWLTKPQTPYTWPFFIRAGIKAAILFAIANVVFAVLDPMPILGQMSIYNVLVPGRERLPYGENPDQSYNVSLTDLNAMFASHEIFGARKAANEYRVILIGDSSIWGVLLDNADTLSGYLNQLNLQLPDGKQVRVFNLGYPDQTLTKDTLILQRAKQYQPDLIVWLTTLESMALKTIPDDRGNQESQQLGSLIVRENPALVRQFINLYQLASIAPNDPDFNERSFVKRTILGQRRALADWLRNQLYGVMSGNTGIDQRYPRFYEPRREHFNADVDWHGLSPKELTENDLALDVLKAGLKIADPVPVVIINEPMFISRGINSDLRYNYFYPRWVYDAYRKLMTKLANENSWQYFDFWNVVPSTEFTDSAVHLTPVGSRLLAEHVGNAILEVASR